MTASLSKWIAIVLVLATAGAACGKSESGAAAVKVGDSKEALLDRLGTPDDDIVMKGGELTTLGFSSDRAAYFRRPQPADEIWLWTYRKDAVYTIENGKVTALPAPPGSSKGPPGPAKETGAPAAR